MTNRTDARFLGGLAIYLAFVIAVLATMHMTRDIFALLLGGTVIVIVGILDDKYQLPAKVKLLGQIAAAFVLVLFDIKIEWLNNPWGGYFYLEYFSVPLTVFWIVSFTNVVNLMDGLDGLAAGVSGIASVTVGYGHSCCPAAGLLPGCRYYGRTCRRHYRLYPLQF